MKYRITMVHGDDFHNKASFITDGHGYKAMLSALKNDKTSSYPFSVRELETGKLVYKTAEWDTCRQIHYEKNKKTDIKCNFCCVAVPATIAPTK